MPANAEAQKTVVITSAASTRGSSPEPFSLPF